MEKEEKKNKHYKLKLFLTNAVTMLRTIGAVALIPVFIEFGGLATAGLLAGLFATDFVDGLMARKLRTSTFFGATLDAASDKLIGIISLILLVSVSKLALAPIIMEGAIVGVNYAKYRKKQNVHSFFSGKLKTFAIAIGSILAFVVSGLIDKGIIKDIDKYKYLLPTLLGMIPFQLATFSAYLKDYKAEKAKKKIFQEEINTAELYDLKKERLKEIEEEKISLAQKRQFWKDYVDNNKQSPLFDHELYENKKEDNELSLDVKCYFEAKKLTRKKKKL